MNKKLPVKLIEEIAKLARGNVSLSARGHAQMQQHFWQDAQVDYEVVFTRGFTALKPCAYTAAAGEPPLNFRVSPSDKSNMAKYLFGGFERCLYPFQKFQSDSERKLTVVLEREAGKWFKPARQFRTFVGCATKVSCGSISADLAGIPARPLYPRQPPKKAGKLPFVDGRPLHASRCRQAVKGCSGPPPSGWAAGVMRAPVW